MTAWARIFPGAAPPTASAPPSRPSATPRASPTGSAAPLPVVALGPAGAVARARAPGLVRQESSFTAAAVSSPGALGLMQRLPATAREVAGRANVPFIQDKLTSDPAYNVALGSQYLSEL